MERQSTREAFGQAILELAREREDIICVAADTSKSMGFGPIAKEFPHRVIDVGIAEQNMMMVASGLASAGKTVFAASYAVFTCMRALEEVRTFIAYPKLNVKIGGGMAGLSGAEEGVTHQGIEDVAIMRAIPNMAVFVPADAVATKEIVRAAVEWDGPAYIRLGRAPTPVFFDSNYHFEIGKANVLYDGGTDATLITMGVMVGRTLEAAKGLANENIHVRVLEMASVKPIDSSAIVRAARETGAIVTVEEHTIIGGLGSAVAEVLVENQPVPMQRLGIMDTFAESAPQEDLLDAYGLSTQRIIQAVKDVVSRK
jgi:transketolase